MKFIIVGKNIEVTPGLKKNVEEYRGARYSFGGEGAS